jgi:hypothetical protein
MIGRMNTTVGTTPNALIFDVHIHSTLSPCSILPLEDILAHARELGLDGVCITDHDTMDAAKYVQEGPQSDGLIVIVGMEYSTPDGQFLVFGPLEDVRPGLGARAFLELVNKRGGAAIAAHPFRMIRPVASHLLNNGLCHAIETINGGNSFIENVQACEASRRLGLPGAGASDAHSLNALGRAASVIDAPVNNREDLVRAIRQGLIRPAGDCPEMQ